jgi:hypothetical protein
MMMMVKRIKTLRAMITRLNRILHTVEMTPLSLKFAGKVDLYLNGLPSMLVNVYVKYLHASIEK